MYVYRAHSSRDKHSVVALWVVQKCTFYLMLTIIVTNALFLVSVIRTFMTIGKQCELIWTLKDSCTSVWFWNPYVLLMTNISHLLFISILCYFLENKWNLCSSLKNDICVNLRLCYEGTKDHLESMIWM